MGAKGEVCIQNCTVALFVQDAVSQSIYTKRISAVPGDEAAEADRPAHEVFSCSAVHCEEQITLTATVYLFMYVCIYLFIHF